MLAFLCGGMEYATNGGSPWRERTRLWIQENLNHRVFDPTEEAKRILSEEEVRNLAEWKRVDVERFRKVMRFVINHDLNVIKSQADYVVCYWDEAAARGGGTQAELTAAFRKGIPIYFVTEFPMPEISGWVLGCTDKIFASFEELRQYLAATYRKEARQRAL
jgi:hypothetical protein